MVLIVFCFDWDALTPLHFYFEELVTLLDDCFQGFWVSRVLIHIILLFKSLWLFGVRVIDAELVQDLKHQIVVWVFWVPLYSHVRKMDTNQ